MLAHSCAATTCEGAADRIAREGAKRILNGAAKRIATRPAKRITKNSRPQVLEAATSWTAVFSR